MIGLRVGVKARVGYIRTAHSDVQPCCRVGGIVLSISVLRQQALFVCSCILSLSLELEFYEEI